MSDKYAFLMVDFETPEFIKELQKKIPDKELYTGDENSIWKYGKEYETHTTLVPCLDNDVDLSKLKECLRDLDEYSVILTDISKFECENYDVLKCCAKSLILEETNKIIKDKFDTHSEHKQYNPHVTIAYLKQGMADKYLKDIISPLVVLKPKQFHFSWWEGDEQKKEIFKN